MFKSFKSKLKNWLGKSEAEDKDLSSEEDLSSPQQEDSQQSEKSHTKDESKKEVPEKKILEEKPKEKKKGFLSKVFSKKSTSSEDFSSSQQEDSQQKEQPTKESESKKKKKTEETISETKKAIKEKSITPPQTKTKPEKEDPSSLQQEDIKQSKKSSSKKESEKEKEKPQTPDNLEESIKDVQEDIEEETEKKGFFAKLKSKFTTATLTEENVEEIFEDLELILLENNVALEVVDKIKENLINDLVGSEVKKDEIESKIIQTLKDTITEVLLEPPNLIEKIKSHPGTYTIIFFGINGSGKTTSIAKLAHKLKENNISCILAAADTFRAAAIQQLETHAKTLEVPIIKHDYNSDPTAVAFDAKKYAEKNKIKCVLIDTAGRMYTKENLIKQMEKIIRVIKPNLKIFVGESITGNDATEQAKTFHEAIGIDGLILSKADVDEKAGTILSVSYITNKPIYFLGVGQTYNDLQPFTKDTVLKNLGLEN